MSKQHTLSELAELLSGSLHGDGDRAIESLASISNAAAFQVKTIRKLISISNGAAFQVKTRRK